MVEPLMPQKRGVMQRVQGVMGMVGQMGGTQGISSLSSLFGGGGGAAGGAIGGGAAAGAAGGGGGTAIGAGAGAAGKYSLGVGNVTPVSDGMSPTLGGGEAAGASTAGEGVMSYAPYAAPVVAGYYEYKAMRDPSKQTSNRAMGGPTYLGSKAMGGLADKVGIGRKNIGDIQTGGLTKGLSLTGEAPDQMSAIERRYNTRQTAMADIEAARQALNQAGLSTQDRRSISQKLEQARIAAGGPKRGATGIA